MTKKSEHSAKNDPMLSSLIVIQRVHQYVYLVKVGIFMLMSP